MLYKPRAPWTHIPPVWQMPLLYLRHMGHEAPSFTLGQTNYIDMSRSDMTAISDEQNFCHVALGHVEFLLGTGQNSPTTAFFANTQPLCTVKTLGRLTFTIYCLSELPETVRLVFRAAEEGSSGPWGPAIWTKDPCSAIAGLPVT